MRGRPGFQKSMLAAVLEERDIVPNFQDESPARGFRARTLATERGYDARDCVAALRGR